MKCPIHGDVCPDGSHPDFEPQEKRGEFSVCQTFVDGTDEYVRRFVDAEEAVKAFCHYAKSVGARMGTTVRVILTDGDDCINWEWQFGKGIVYPTAADIAQMEQEQKS